MVLKTILAGVAIGLLLASVGCGSGGSGTGGTTPAPVVSFSTASLTFTSENINGTSAAQSATLTNTGNANLSIASLVATGDFGQTNNCPVSLAPGANCTIQVTFTATATGARTGTLMLTDNALGSPQSVALKGTGGAALFYVASNGKDIWSGTLPAPNATNSDGPFATFDHARLTVRGINKTGLSQVVVQFRTGTYFLPATEQFSAADSGTATMQIIYQNFSGESPVFSGGMRITNWTNTSDNIWQTTLPPNTQYFENIFYNDVRRLRPRLAPGATTPQEAYVGTYLRVANPVILSTKPTAPLDVANCPKVSSSPNQWECFDRFTYSSSAIIDTWQNLAPQTGNPCGLPAGNPFLAGDIELLIFEQFTASKLRISCVDTTNSIIYLTGPTPFNSGRNGFIQFHRYVVENVKDALTQPGQWFLDHSAGPNGPWTLTYLANPGENPNTDIVIVPQLPPLQTKLPPAVLVASGLRYVTFQGLTFEHDNYTIPTQGYKSEEVDSQIPAAVSFQNSQNITFDSNIVRETSGAGMEILSCVGASSASWCAGDGSVPPSSNIHVTNSAFYDVAGSAIRIGAPQSPDDTDTNVPHSINVENTVVEGWGRTFPSTFGIAQAVANNNVYLHNDVYDGYHVGISISISGQQDLRPNSNGPANNIIWFNHVHDTHQGIMNDGGAVRVGAGNGVFTAAGNKMLNNRVHDVNSAAVLDGASNDPGCQHKNPTLPCDGYGGHGLYFDNQTGSTEAKNNLVYRVSDSAVNFPKAPACTFNGAVCTSTPNTVTNNIFAFARRSMLNDVSPYDSSTSPPPVPTFIATSNIFYFDRNPNSPELPFYVQGDCTFIAPGFTYRDYQQWDSNLYFRKGGGFDTDINAFHFQTTVGTGPSAPCININPTMDPLVWPPLSFAGWQGLGQDLQGTVTKDPGFANPSPVPSLLFPADDYSLPNGSPGVGFVVFDPTQAGRTNPVINPPAVPATFLTGTFSKVADF